MKDFRLREGTYARVGGSEYSSTGIKKDGTVRIGRPGDQAPPDERFVYDPDWPGWQAVIPVAECEELFVIENRASYRGLPCHVFGLTEDGQVSLYFIGNNDGYAKDAGFEQVDRGTYGKQVSLKELTLFHEIRRDLLFDQELSSLREQAGEEA
jgi:hypothetical protein